MKKPFPMKLGVSLAIVVAVVGMALLGPLFGMDPYFIDPDQPTALPSMAHWLGTDELGRDLFARLTVGAQASLIIGLSTALVAVVIGTTYGTTAAYFEGPIDTLMMRIIDVLYSLPAIMVVILLTILLNGLFDHIFQGYLEDYRSLIHLISLVLALSLFSWPDTARIIRGEVLRLKRQDFVEAFHSLGGHPIQLIMAHIIPNLASLIILTATITVPRAILTESTLSFIGLGVPSPYSTWGTMIRDGWQMMRIAPHLIFLPGLFLFTTMIALNLLGDHLKEVFQPKTAQHH